MRKDIKVPAQVIDAGPPLMVRIAPDGVDTQIEMANLDLTLSDGDFVVLEKVGSRWSVAHKYGEVV
jgi:hypothetical protein